MLNTRVLVVDDDTDILFLIKEYLSSNDYDVDCAKDGLEGIRLYNNNKYDLIILDIVMPKLDGYSFCKIIRQKSDIPIIFITELREEQNQIKAFEMLCDDYIIKPLSLTLLQKRVEAVLRRYKKEEVDTYLKFGDINLNLKTYSLEIEGEKIELTLKEFNILKALIENYPQVITREKLLDSIWGYDYYGDTRIVDAHIKNIRKKMVLPYIKTVKGIGYTLVNDLK